MALPHRRAIIWGGTGQARVVHRLLTEIGLSVACVCDRDPAVTNPIAHVPIWRREDEFLSWLDGEDRPSLCFVAAIGGQRGGNRIAVHEYLTRLNVEPVSLVHPTAWVDGSVVLGTGNQILAMAAVGVDAALGTQCIVNTNATIDHGCRIGHGVHVMPGAVVTGEVEIGDAATVGSNATILPRLTIGSGAVIGAGAVVTEDVVPGAIVVGVPARVTSITRRAADRHANPWFLPSGTGRDSI